LTKFVREALTHATRHAGPRNQRRPRVAPIRVIVAEDAYLVREAIELILAGAPEIEVARSCADADSLLLAVEEEQPDAVITDIRMPPSETDDGIRVAHIPAREPPPHRRSGAEPSTPSRAIRWRCSTRASSGRAYLLKESLHNRAQLVAAVEAVVAGESVIDPKVVEVLVDARGAPRRPRRCPSSRHREYEVLAEIAKGEEQCGNRVRPVPHQASGREAHQFDLHEAQPCRTADEVSPPREGHASCFLAGPGDEQARVGPDSVRVVRTPTEVTRGGRPLPRARARARCSQTNALQEETLSDLAQSESSPQPPSAAPSGRRRRTLIVALLTLATITGVIAVVVHLGQARGARHQQLHQYQLQAARGPGHPECRVRLSP